MNTEDALNSPVTLQEVMTSCNIRTLYQPIVRLADGLVVGYEALSRGPRATPLESPLALLEAAKQEQCLWELEILLRRMAIEGAGGLASGQLLFLNVDPRIINDPDFHQGLTREYLERQGLSPGVIAFEITERYAIKDHPTFNRVLQNYREQGYLIAIDDAGSGYSGMHTIAVTAPDYVKIDMDIVRNVHSDPLRQAIVKSFVLLGQIAGIRIVAEGIETREELKALIQLGVYAGQGYYIQRPIEGIQPLDEEKCSEICTIGRLLSVAIWTSQCFQWIKKLLGVIKGEIAALGSQR